MSQTDFTATQALSALRAADRGAARPAPLEQAAFDAAHRAVAAARNAAMALDATETAWAAADTLWNEVRATPAFALGSPQAACKRGCGWCCHQRVGAAAIEVLAMARALATRPEAALLEGWTPGKPCAFLQDGACAIYDIRPLKCRSLWHVDVRACMGKYAGLPVMGGAVSDAFVAEPKMIYEGALKGLALPLIKAGRDCPGVELMPALKAVIGQPDAADRWWRGEAVFPKDARLDWFPPARRKGVKP